MKLGVLGAGFISETTAPTMAALQEIECHAVASRSLEKARDFAGRHGFARAYGSPTRNFWQIRRWSLSTLRRRIPITMRI